MAFTSFGSVELLMLLPFYFEQSATPFSSKGLTSALIKKLKSDKFYIEKNITYTLKKLAT
jgi:hypothetical protein